jgi:cation transport regulator ChaC
MMQRIAVFAYGSLASRASAERTLGRPVEHAGVASLGGWRRRWSQARDNTRVEKTFARPDGSIPRHCLGLNLEPGHPGAGPNGALIELTEPELDRLAARELRYDRVEITNALSGGAGPRFDRVYTFVAKPENFARSVPAGAVIVAAYARAVQAAFDSLGPGQLDLFNETTGPFPVELIEATLVRDRIPSGNPREW